MLTAYNTKEPLMIEVIAGRGPDGDSTLAWFQDGAPVSAQDIGVRVVDVDPIRSGADSKWRESLEGEAATLSPACAAALLNILLDYY